MSELRREWREVVYAFIAAPKFGDTEYDLALRLQAIADEEGREAFEAGREVVTVDTFPFDKWKHPTYADYLKSQEET